MTIKKHIITDINYNDITFRKNGELPMIHEMTDLKKNKIKMSPKSQTEEKQLNNSLLKKDAYTKRRNSLENFNNSGPSKKQTKNLSILSDFHSKGTFKQEGSKKTTLKDTDSQTPNTLPQSSLGSQLSKSPYNQHQSKLHNQIRPNFCSETKPKHTVLGNQSQNQAFKNCQNQQATMNSMPNRQNPFYTAPFQIENLFPLDGFQNGVQMPQSQNSNLRGSQLARSLMETYLQTLVQNMDPQKENFPKQNTLLDQQDPLLSQKPQPIFQQLFNAHLSSTPSGRQNVSNVPDFQKLPIDRRNLNLKDFHPNLLFDYFINAYNHSRPYLDRFWQDRYLHRNFARYADDDYWRNFCLESPQGFCMHNPRDCYMTCCPNCCTGCKLPCCCDTCGKSIDCCTPNNNCTCHFQINACPCSCKKRDVGVKTRSKSHSPTPQTEVYSPKKNSSISLSSSSLYRESFEIDLNDSKNSSNGLFMQDKSYIQNDKIDLLQKQLNILNQKLSNHESYFKNKLLSNNEKNSSHRQNTFPRIKVISKRHRARIPLSDNNQDDFSCSFSKRKQFSDRNRLILANIQRLKKKYMREKLFLQKEYDLGKKLKSLNQGNKKNTGKKISFWENVNNENEIMEYASGEMASNPSFSYLKIARSEKNKSMSNSIANNRKHKNKKNPKKGRCRKNVEKLFISNNNLNSLSCQNSSLNKCLIKKKPSIRTSCSCHQHPSMWVDPAEVSNSNYKKNTKLSERCKLDKLNFAANMLNNNNGIGFYTSIDTDSSEPIFMPKARKGILSSEHKPRKKNKKIDKICSESLDNKDEKTSKNKKLENKNIKKLFNKELSSFGLSFEDRLTSRKRDVVKAIKYETTPHNFEFKSTNFYVPLSKVDKGFSFFVSAPSSNKKRTKNSESKYKSFKKFDCENLIKSILIGDKGRRKFKESNQSRRKKHKCEEKKIMERLNESKENKEKFNKKNRYSGSFDVDKPELSDSKNNSIKKAIFSSKKRSHRKLKKKVDVSKNSEPNCSFNSSSNNNSLPENLNWNNKFASNKTSGKKHTESFNHSTIQKIVSKPTSSNVNFKKNMSGQEVSFSRRLTASKASKQPQGVSRITLFPKISKKLSSVMNTTPSFCKYRRMPRHHETFMPSPNYYASSSHKYFANSDESNSAKQRKNSFSNSESSKIQKLKEIERMQLEKERRHQMNVFGYCM